MLRTFYQITEKELYHIVLDSDEEIYTLNLFFVDEYFYQECIHKLKGKLQLQEEGYTFLNFKGTYKISLQGLTLNDRNDLHGFRSYLQNKKLIRVYWNNKNKTIIFYE